MENSVRIIGIILLVLTSTYANAGVENEIKSMILENLRATQAEEMEAALKTVHTASGGYAVTKQMLQQIFSTYDLKYTLLEYKFVGEESGYAYARIKQLTEKINGPEFRTNELEALQVFKQENGVWKMWTQANLSITFK